MGAAPALVFGVLAYAVTGWPLSFETEADLAALEPSGLKTFARVQEHASDGDWALQVVFPGSDRDTWPGFSVLPPDPDLSAGQSLVFDAYNPSEQTCSLSWRIDDLDQHSVFGGQGLPPRKTTRVEVWTKPLRYQLNLARMKRFYIYYRMPREDWQVYFDNFHFAEIGEVFRKVTHLPERQPTALPAAEGPSLVAFTRPWMDPVFGDDWPAEDQGVQELSLTAARGEYEPLTVCIAARRDLHGLAAELSDFEGPGKIPQEQADLRVVRAMDKRWTYSDAAKRYVADMPVLLEPQPRDEAGALAGVELAAGKVATFWITLKVPPRAGPGVYEATLTITAQDAAQGAPTTLELPVRLRVYPFELPEVKDKLWGVYYTGPCPLEAGEELDKLERNLVDMREHGMTSVGLCFGWDTAQTDVEGRRVDFLPPGNGRYETFMDLYRKLGYPAPVIQLSDTVQSAVGAEIPPDDPRFAEAYADTWRFVTDYAAVKKWPEIIVQPVDEPAWQGEALMERNRQLLEILKRLAPGIRTEQDGPGDDYFHRVAGPLADVWNYNGSLAAPEVIQEAKDQGKLILIYNNDVEWYRPVVDRYSAGWFQVLSGADGCFNWAYQSFSGDPYDDQDARYGDHIAQYPALRNLPGGPSTAWEGFREGIDDYRYVALLETLIERGLASKKEQAQQIAREAREKLEGLAASLEYSPRVRNAAVWEDYREENGQLFVSGVITLSNGWSSADYDRARRTIADLAARLVGAL